MLSFASELIRHHSSGPPGDTSAVCHYAKEWLSRFGISASLYEPLKGNVSLVARIGSGSNTLILNSHLDVVPITNEPKWRFPPFCGEIRGGRLLGRGASDTKGGCAAITEALLALSQLERELDGQVTLSLVADEESGGAHGTRFLVEKGVIKGDFAIVAEPTGTDTLIVGEKGLLRFLLTAKGKAGHASMAGAVGENAISKLSALIDPITAMHGRRYDPPPAMRNALLESGRLLVGITKNPAAKDIPRSTTTSIGVIRGGVKANVIPDSAEMEVDMRLPLGLEPNEMKRELAGLMKAGTSMKVQTESGPNFSDPSDRHVRLLLAQVQKITGRRARTAIYWASTDSKHLRGAGIPTVTYGPGDWSAIHAVNESASTRSISTCAKVYFEFAKKLLIP